MSPLILGKVTRWRPHAEARSATADAPLPFERIGVAVLGTSALGCLIAWMVYRSSRWSGRTVSVTTLPPTQMPVFDQAQVQSGVMDTLKEIARDGSPSQRDEERP